MQVYGSLLHMADRIGTIDLNHIGAGMYDSDSSESSADGDRSASEDEETTGYNSGESRLPGGKGNGIIPRMRSNSAESGPRSRREAYRRDRATKEQGASASDGKKASHSGGAFASGPYANVMLPAEAADLLSPAELRKETMRVLASARWGYELALEQFTDSELAAISASAFYRFHYPFHF